MKKTEETKENMEESYAINIQCKSTDYKHLFQDSEHYEVIHELLCRIW